MIFNLVFCMLYACFSAHSALKSIELTDIIIEANQPPVRKVHFAETQILNSEQSQGATVSTAIIDEEQLQTKEKHNFKFLKNNTDIPGVTYPRPRWNENVSTCKACCDKKVFCCAVTTGCVGLSLYIGFLAFLYTLRAF